MRRVFFSIFLSPSSPQAQVTAPDASSRILFDQSSPLNGRVIVRQTGRYRSLAFVNSQAKAGDPASAVGHIQSVAATPARDARTGGPGAVIPTELVPAYARLMLAAGLVAADAGGTGLLEGKVRDGLLGPALVAGGGAGSLAAALAAVLCASDAAAAGLAPTPTSLASPTPPCTRRTRALSIEADPVVAAAAEAWFGVPGPSGGGAEVVTPLGVAALTADAAPTLAASSPGSTALVFMDAMVGGGGGGGGGGEGEKGGSGGAGGGGAGEGAAAAPTPSQAPTTPPAASHHPPSMLAPPFLAAVSAALAPGGALVANLVFTGPDPAARADAVRAWAAAAVDALSARPGTGGDARHRPAAAYVARPPPSSGAESSNLIVLVCKPTDDDTKQVGDATAATYLGGEVGASALRRAIPRVAAAASAGGGLGDLASILASLRPLEVGPRYGEWPLPASAGGGGGGGGGGRAH